MTDPSIARIRDLLPAIRDRSLEIENARRIRPDLVDNLKDAGIFRLMAPKSHGGDETGFGL